MDILVTGGAGFIGGHLAESFAEDGHDVVVLDNFEPYYDLGIKEHNVEVARSAADSSTGSYELIRGLTTDADLVADIVSRVDVVYHQAAQAGVRTSVKEPRKVTDYNVEGTLNVLDAARDAEVTRVVNASSSGVYGIPEYLPYDEDHPTTPRGLEVDRRALRACVQRGVRTADGFVAVLHRVRPPNASEHGDHELRLAVSAR